MAKPRVRFCFECGRQLWGNRHVVAVLKADGRERVLHKACLKENETDYQKAKGEVVE
jgi:hypothetical protein